MCLAIPAKISERFAHEPNLATVDVMGVRRKVNIELLAEDPPQIGDWVLVHVGFAMSKISAELAGETLQMLAGRGEVSAAQEEISGYSFESDS